MPVPLHQVSTLQNPQLMQSGKRPLGGPQRRRIPLPNLPCRQTRLSSDDPQYHALPGVKRWRPFPTRRRSVEIACQCAAAPQFCQRFHADAVAVGGHGEKEPPPSRSEQSGGGLRGPRHGLLRQRRPSGDGGQAATGSGVGTACTEICTPLLRTPGRNRIEPAARCGPYAATLRYIQAPSRRQDDTIKPASLAISSRENEKGDVR